MNKITFAVMCFFVASISAAAIQTISSDSVSGKIVLHHEIADQDRMFAFKKGLSLGPNGSVGPIAVNTGTMTIGSKTISFSYDFRRGAQLSQLLRWTFGAWRNLAASFEVHDHSIDFSGCGEVPADIQRDYEGNILSLDVTNEGKDFLKKCLIADWNALAKPYEYYAGIPWGVYVEFEKSFDDYSKFEAKFDEQTPLEIADVGIRCKQEGTDSFYGKIYSCTRYFKGSLTSVFTAIKNQKKF